MKFSHSKSIDGLLIYPQPGLLVIEFGRWCEV